MRNLKGFLLHIGADTSKRNLGVVGPRFPEGTFEFIPLGPEYESHTVLTYNDLPARNIKYGKTLGDFLPSQIASWNAHCDPNFKSYTYGEPAKDEPKQIALKKLDEGNLLYFISSLVPYDSSIYRNRDSELRRYQKGKMNKYVIGFFTIEGVAIANVSKGEIYVENLAGNINKSDVRSNQHYSRLPIREKGNLYESDTFVIIKGNPICSALFRVAIPITCGQTKTPRGGHTFRLNYFGHSIRHRKTDSLRGIRPLGIEEIRILGRETVKFNPELKARLGNLL